MSDSGTSGRIWTLKFWTSLAIKFFYSLQTFSQLTTTVEKIQESGANRKTNFTAQLPSQAGKWHILLP